MRTVCVVSQQAAKPCDNRIMNIIKKYYQIKTIGQGGVLVRLLMPYTNFDYTFRINKASKADQVSRNQPDYFIHKRVWECTAGMALHWYIAKSM